MSLFQRSGDLAPSKFPSLDWSEAQALESLEKLRAYVEAEARSAHDWYLRNKRSKRTLGRVLRIMAILFAGAAGLVPVISQLSQRGDQSVVAPGWSPLFLGFAALCLGFDRFFNGVGSWTRFMLAAEDISRLLNAFLFDWESRRARWQGRPPSSEETEAAIACCRKFVDDVGQVVRVETKQWEKEFETALRETHREPPKPPPEEP